MGLTARDAVRVFPLVFALPHSIFEKGAATESSKAPVEDFSN